MQIPACMRRATLDLGPDVQPPLQDVPRWRKDICTEVWRAPSAEGPVASQAGRSPTWLPTASAASCCDAACAPAPFFKLLTRAERPIRGQEMDHKLRYCMRLFHVPDPRSSIPAGRNSQSLTEHLGWCWALAPTTTFTQQQNEIQQTGRKSARGSSGSRGKRGCVGQLMADPALLRRYNTQ